MTSEPVGADNGAQPDPANTTPPNPSPSGAKSSKAKPSKEDSSMRSTVVVSFFTMLSRVLGLVRDMVFANFVGATAAADAFYVAFKIPNFLRRLFAEGAFSQAFVPVLSEYRQQRDLVSVKSLVDHVAGALGSSLAVLTGLAIMIAPLLALIFAPGFFFEFSDEAPWLIYKPSEQAEHAVSMLRVTFPYLLLISLTAFASSILNSYGRFAVPAFTPVLLNLSLIGAVFFIAPGLSNPVMGLAWGVLIAGAVQLLFQLPFLARIQLLPAPKLDRQHEGVRTIGRLMIPALFGVSVSQINLLLDTVLASFLQTGSVSWLYYSDRLVELPLGVIAIAIATVILPKLSRQHAASEAGNYRATLDWALRLVCVIGLPAGVALFLLAEPLIATLFQRGATTETDVLMAAMSLRAYAFGLLAFMFIKVLAPGYYSRQDTRTPVRIAVVAMVANMVLNLILVWPLQHAGLALATSLAAFLNAGLLLAGLYRLGIFQLQSGWGALLLRILAANLLMAIGLLVLTSETAQWFAWDAWQRTWHLAILCCSGAVLYFAGLFVLGLRLRDFRR